MKNICATDQSLTTLLEAKGISPTSQRVQVLRALRDRCEHLSAEDVFVCVNRDSPAVSKATVYNTLSLFVERGLIREVIADPTRIYYDPNIEPHHHIYNSTTGQLTDIHLDDVQIQGLPNLAPDVRVEGIDVIVRVRSERPQPD